MTNTTQVLPKLNIFTGALVVELFISMTLKADSKRQRLPLTFYSFLVILKKTQKNRKVSLTIHSKYKYFDSTIQRAEDRRQKFHFHFNGFGRKLSLRAICVAPRQRKKRKYKSHQNKSKNHRTGNWVTLSRCKFARLHL